MSVIYLNQKTLDPDLIITGDVNEPVSISTASNTIHLSTPLQRISKYINNTGEEINDFISRDSAHASIHRLYPHIFDTNSQAGEAIALIQHAKNDAILALDSFGEPDLNSTVSHLTNVASAMNSANQLINFNKSLNGVVSYIRRATLTVDINDISRSSLNTLASTLQSILENPMIDLDNASDLVEKLSSDGWKGEIEFVEALIAALLTDTEDNVQTELFTETTAQND